MKSYSESPRDSNQVSDEKWMKSPVNLLATHPESNQGNWVSDMKLPNLCNEHWTTMIRHFIGCVTEIVLPSNVKNIQHCIIASWFDSSLLKTINIYVFFRFSLLFYLISEIAFFMLDEIPLNSTLLLSIWARNSPKE